MTTTDLPTKEYAENWITSGWSRDPNGKWGERGSSSTVEMIPPALQPEIKIHGVAARLNALEAEIAALKAASQIS